MSTFVTDSPATTLVETFARAGVLGNTEVHFAMALHRLRPDEPDIVLLAAALAMRAPHHGHVCIEPARVAGTVVVDDGGAGVVIDLPWPDSESWSEAIEASALVALDHSGDLGPGQPLENAAGHGSADGGDPVRGQELRPLVWDGQRLYLHRYWDYEARVAARVVDRVHGPLRFLHDNQPLPDNFDDLFPEAVPSQRNAAVAALNRSLAVITGGPGTGKTHTIAGIVAAMLDASGDDDRPLQIALAAPTGKAAQRLTESVQQGRIGASDRAQAQMATLEARTIHRLLGSRHGSFLHDAHNPLPVDVVIVDEMSMVSLPLMARLLDAIPHDARVVLVGDPEQLASVEAGSVLHDLVAALPPWTVTELAQVFRQEASSPIIPFASAVQAGDLAEVRRLLADPATPLELVDPAGQPAVEALEVEVAGHAGEVVARADDPAAALEMLSTLRVLTATRNGPGGRGAWTRAVEQKLAARIEGRRSLRRWYGGRPVIVTENDYLNQLMNGDVGLVTRPGDPEEERSVAFNRAGELVLVSPTRLQAVETVWAMTIHKSQGSEFDAVVVSLPDVPSALLSRELLYTAVTRARERVVIVATNDALAAAVETRVHRASGLARRMAVEVPDEALEPASVEPPAQLSLWDLT